MHDYYISKTSPPYLVTVLQIKLKKNNLWIIKVNIQNLEKCWNKLQFQNFPNKSLGHMF